MDSNEVTPEERAEEIRLLTRQLNRVYRMYTAYRRDDGEILSFPEYAWLFHNIDPEMTKQWVSTGEIT